MENFRLYVPILVRYGDLDPQWHVNNAKFLTFLEQSRVAYLQHLQLWDGRDFFQIGLIVADIHIAYLLPIELGQALRVGIRVAHLGNKSMRFEYQIEGAQGSPVFARAETVMVSYDYVAQSSRTIPEDWRAKIAAFEGIAPRS
jgi:acyl-CoA thioester hydrolase